jgi:hypothetical protein
LFLFFSLSSLFTNYKEERGEREKQIKKKRNRKILEAYQNSNDDTISSVKKISTR